MIYELEEEQFDLQFFAYEHLPDHLKKVSQPFGELAEKLVTEIPQTTDNTELEMCIRKLLEAKDCAVRAVIYKPKPT